MSYTNYQKSIVELRIARTVEEIAAACGDFDLIVLTLIAKNLNIFHKCWNILTEISVS